MQASTEQRPAFRRSVEAQKLIDRLSTLEPGDKITYAEMSELVGADLQGNARHYLQTARRALAVEKGMHFGVIRNYGMQRKTDHEMAQSGPQYRNKIRRVARKGMRELSSVQDFEALTPAEKEAHNRDVANIGTLYLFTKPKTVARIAQETTRAGKAIGVEETLRLFQKSE